MLEMLQQRGTMPMFFKRGWAPRVCASS